MLIAARVIRRLATIFLLACLQPVPAQDAANTELVVIDLRPKEEKDGVGLAPLSGKCNQGVFRIADVASDPLKVDALKAVLERMMPVADAAKTLTVLNWSIYYNTQVGHSGTKGRVSNVMGYAIPTGKEKKTAATKCPRKESAGGWYEAGEVTTSHPPIVSELTGTYGGKPVNVRVVHSPRQKIAGKFEGGADDTQELLDTVQETAEALAMAMVQ